MLFLFELLPLNKFNLCLSSSFIIIIIIIFFQ